MAYELKLGLNKAATLLHALRSNRDMHCPKSGQQADDLVMVAGACMFGPL